MVELIRENWLPLALALLIGFLVAWWLFARASRLQRLRERERNRRPDVLDEGTAPAQRNQALIDAPSAAAITPPAVGEAMAGETIGGIGEIVAVAAQEEAESARTSAAAPVTGEADDLRRIKGVGPKLVALLDGLGVSRFDQIAAWDDAEIDRIDAQLGAFAGRIRRDNWVEQARLLASGDTSAYEAKFGKL
ncbi:MAG: hypothetical protein M0R03_13580 [Novosphingobium sp.]|nr:hypothetical protein [Novosphingobium sp.]